MLIVVTYDIADDKLRTRLHKTLRRFGDPVQYSVFECLLTPEQLMQMRAAIAETVGNEGGSVRYYELCRSCQPQTVTLGRAVTTSVPLAYIL
jgi:CRISPR-associated protein Cas2